MVAIAPGDVSQCDKEKEGKERDNRGECLEVSNEVTSSPLNAD